MKKLFILSVFLLFTTSCKVHEAHIINANNQHNNIKHKNHKTVIMHFYKLPQSTNSSNLELNYTSSFIYWYIIMNNNNQYLYTSSDKPLDTTDLKSSSWTSSTQPPINLSKSKIEEEDETEMTEEEIQSLDNVSEKEVENLLEEHSTQEEADTSDDDVATNQNEQNSDTTENVAQNETTESSENSENDNSTSSESSSDSGGE